MKRLTCISVAVGCLALCSVPAAAFNQSPSVVVTQPPCNQFKAISWNVDSGGADPHVVSVRISEMNDVSLWGFCEVQNELWAELFEQAANGLEPGRFARITSPTAGRDRSCILYDRTQFDCLGWFEFSWAGQPWYSCTLALRPGLVAHLRHRVTRQELYFMVNLFRGTMSDKQAAVLTEWARCQEIPVLAVGTYDFEYRPETQPPAETVRRGYPALTATGVFQWIMPDNPMPTVSRGELGAIDDFVLLADPQHKFAGRSQVMVQPEDFPDNDLTPDHRPVAATLIIKPVAG